MVGQAYKYSSKARTQGRKTNPYLTKEIMEASQEKLLLKTYDFAIVHCKKGDNRKANKAIDVLINGLDIQHQVGRELYSLYVFCKEQLNEGNNEIACEILTSLKEAWITAFNKEKIAV